jgi:hypothetical protein
VTGQALARFVLFDGDPRLLTAEMIRGRGVERSLGVVADLVRRWDGLVDVTPGTGEFTKASRCSSRPWRRPRDPAPQIPGKRRVCISRRLGTSDAWILRRSGKFAEVCDETCLDVSK